MVLFNCIYLRIRYTYHLPLGIEEEFEANSCSLKMALLTWSSAIALWIAVTCGISFWLLPYDPFTTKPLVASLLFFNNLNIFIAICEICLGYHIMFIREDYRKRKAAYPKGKEWDGCLALLTMPITVKEMFQGKTWALMWSTYALFDPSYQNYESFGFFVDVGNGYTTILPCLFLNYGIIYPYRVNQLILACVVIASYWQMLYGTIIYFLSFVFNKRYEGHNKVSIFLFVGLTNGVWFFFPAAAIYSAYCILRDGDMSVFNP